MAAWSPAAAAETNGEYSSAPEAVELARVRGFRSWRFVTRLVPVRDRFRRPEGCSAIADSIIAPVSPSPIP